ncbi:MAG: aspartate/glutamate racemase family protein [bacterium]|nr:aspartate/glutamate racemase family protein [bacterium]
MIGIFDSGLGGLTILKSILNYESGTASPRLRDYNYLYLGDNARAPYGGKSQEVIYAYTCEAIDFLFAKKCKLIILACNTASSKALRKIQQEYLPARFGEPPVRRVLGVIRPLVEKVVHDNFKKVGVIGTRATIESNVYEIEIMNLVKKRADKRLSASPDIEQADQRVSAAPDIEIIQQAAPLLVPLIEEGWLNKPETKMILKKYLRPLKTKQVDVLIPACTHYPFLLNEIQRVMTRRCAVLNPGAIVAESLASYLRRHPELGIKPSEKPIREFYTTDSITKFKSLGEKFLSQPINNIAKVSLS